MFDLGMPIAGGRQTLSVLKGSLRLASPSIEIDIHRRHLVCSAQSYPQKVTAPKGGAACCASERAQCYAIAELSRRITSTAHRAESSGGVKTRGKTMQTFCPTEREENFAHRG